MTSPTEPRSFVPALGFHWLTRFYDPILRATLKEEKFKSLLTEQAALRPGDRVDAAPNRADWEGSLPLHPELSSEDEVDTRRSPL